MSQLGSFIRGTADILRGPYKASQYGNVTIEVLARIGQALGVQLSDICQITKKKGVDNG